MRTFFGIGIVACFVAAGIVLPPRPVASPQPEFTICKGDCAKENEPCPSGVLCCPGLTCKSSSGGDPTCVER